MNRDDLTNALFSPHPFLPGERIYRTGDLARWLPDGNLEYISRIDRQMKIRGKRIEPAEIEARLLEMEGVQEAAVTLREKDGRRSCTLITSVITKKQIRIFAPIWRVCFQTI